MRRTVHIILPFKRRRLDDMGRLNEDITYNIAKVSWRPYRHYLTHSYLIINDKYASYYHRDNNLEFCNKENAARYFRKIHPRAKLLILRDDQNLYREDGYNYVVKFFQKQHDKQSKKQDVQI